MDGENPLEQPIPDDPIQQIHELARDIAYLAINNECTPHFKVTQVPDQARIIDEGLNNALRKKWNDLHNYYRVHFLVGFGYLERSESQPPNKPEVVIFDLTPKAYALLEKPIRPPSVFISYRQQESSALGLLVEARLKLVDRNISVFIDKLLMAGDDWEQQLQATVKQSRYFICLLSKETLASSTTVRREIEWALEDDARVIIPICHNGYNVEDPTYHENFGKRQAVIVSQENAKEYESAVNDVLLRLGYSTI